MAYPAKQHPIIQLLAERAAVEQEYEDLNLANYEDELKEAQPAKPNYTEEDAKAMAALKEFAPLLVIKEGNAPNSPIKINIPTESAKSGKKHAAARAARKAKVDSYNAKLPAIIEVLNQLALQASADNTQGQSAAARRSKSFTGFLTGSGSRQTPDAVEFYNKINIAMLKLHLRHKATIQLALQEIVNKAHHDLGAIQTIGSKQFTTLDEVTAAFDQVNQIADALPAEVTVHAEFTPAQTAEILSIQGTLRALKSSMEEAASEAGRLLSPGGSPIASSVAASSPSGSVRRKLFEDEKAGAEAETTVAALGSVAAVAALAAVAVESEAAVAALGAAAAVAAVAAVAVEAVEAVALEPVVASTNQDARVSTPSPRSSEFAAAADEATQLVQQGGDEQKGTASYMVIRTNEAAAKEIADISAFMEKPTWKLVPEVSKAQLMRKLSALQLSVVDPSAFNRIAAINEKIQAFALFEASRSELPKTESGLDGPLVLAVKQNYADLTAQRDRMLEEIAGVTLAATELLEDDVSNVTRLKEASDKIKALEQFIQSAHPDATVDAKEFAAKIDAYQEKSKQIFHRCETARQAWQAYLDVNVDNVKTIEQAVHQQKSMEALFHQAHPDSGLRERELRSKHQAYQARIKQLEIVIGLREQATQLQDLTALASLSTVAGYLAHKVRFTEIDALLTTIGNLPGKDFPADEKAALLGLHGGLSQALGDAASDIKTDFETRAFTSWYAGEEATQSKDAAEIVNAYRALRSVQEDLNALLDSKEGTYESLLAKAARDIRHSYPQYAHRFVVSNASQAPGPGFKLGVDLSALGRQLSMNFVDIEKAKFTKQFLVPLQASLDEYGRAYDKLGIGAPSTDEFAQRVDHLDYLLGGLQLAFDAAQDELGKVPADAVEKQLWLEVKRQLSSKEMQELESKLDFVTQEYMAAGDELTTRRARDEEFAQLKSAFLATLDDFNTRTITPVKEAVQALEPYSSTVVETTTAELAEARMDAEEALVARYRQAASAILEAREKLSVLEKRFYGQSELKIDLEARNKLHEVQASLNSATTLFCSKDEKLVVDLRADEQQQVIAIADQFAKDHQNLDQQAGLERLLALMPPKRFYLSVIAQSQDDDELDADSKIDIFQHAALYVGQIEETNLSEEEKANPHNFLSLENFFKMLNSAVVEISVIERSWERHVKIITDRTTSLFARLGVQKNEHDADVSHPSPFTEKLSAATKLLAKQDSIKQRLSALKGSSAKLNMILTAPAGWSYGLGMAREDQKRKEFLIKIRKAIMAFIFADDVDQSSLALTALDALRKEGISIFPTLAVNDVSLRDVLSTLYVSAERFIKPFDLSHELVNSGTDTAIRASSYRTLAKQGFIAVPVVHALGAQAVVAEAKSGDLRAVDGSPEQGSPELVQQEALAFKKLMSAKPGSKEARTYFATSATEQDRTGDLALTQARLKAAFRVIASQVKGMGHFSEPAQSSPLQLQQHSAVDAQQNGHSVANGSVVEVEVEPSAAASNLAVA